MFESVTPLIALLEQKISSLFINFLMQRWGKGGYELSVSLSIFMVFFLRKHRQKITKKSHVSSRLLSKIASLQPHVSVPVAYHIVIFSAV